MVVNDKSCRIWPIRRYSPIIRLESRSKFGIYRARSRNSCIHSAYHGTFWRYRTSYELLFVGNVAWTEITRKWLSSSCSWRAWRHREAIFCMVSCLHSTAAFQLLSQTVGLANFPFPLPLFTVKAGPFCTSCTVSSVSSSTLRGSVKQEELYCCCMPGTVVSCLL
jgi:hypothetical protein